MMSRRVFQSFDEVPGFTLDTLPLVRPDRMHHVLCELETSRITWMEKSQRTFWLAVQDLKRRPLQDVPARTQEIWEECLAEGAPSAINLDSHRHKRPSQNLKDSRRYSFNAREELSNVPPCDM
ncbi:regulator of G-protein signaling 6 [Tachysurus ichikawai]